MVEWYEADRNKPCPFKVGDVVQSKKGENYTIVGVTFPATISAIDKAKFEWCVGFKGDNKYPKIPAPYCNILKLEKIVSVVTIDGEDYV